MEQYVREKRELQIRDGKIHSEIWRLVRMAGTAPLIVKLQQELHANQVRVRTLDYLMKYDVPDTSRDPSEPDI